MTEQAHVGAPVLEAENLSIQFGGLKALQELSFSIPEKTVFSIIGPNGAGKTTFFQHRHRHLPANGRRCPPLR